MNIDELLKDTNGGGILLNMEHRELRFNVQRLTDLAATAVFEPDVDFLILTPRLRAEMKTLAPALTLYNQRDPRWRGLVYAGNMTFGAAGCYTVAVAIRLSLAGYEDDPPTVAAKLREVGCYSGALLTRPDRIPKAYPLMRYDGTARWHRVAADMEEFEIELSKGPVIIEVDFVPPTAVFNQHFVLALRFTSDGKDLVIADPWDGAETQLLTRYAQDHWNLGRALYGMRLLRSKDD